MRDHTVQSGAHVSNMQLRPLIAYTVWWTFGAIEFRFGSLTSILKSQYYFLNECGNNRLNTSFLMKFYKTCDLIWNLNRFC